MKKKTIGILLLIGMILIASSVGCNSKQMESKEEDSVNHKEEIFYDAEAEDTKKDMMEDFNNIVKGDNEPFILVKFIDNNIKKLTEEYRIEIVIKLEEIQEEYIGRYTDELFTEGYQMELLSLNEATQSNDGTEDYSLEILFFNENNIEEIKNEDLKDLVEKLVDGKYKLINIEGGFYPIIDYEALKDYDEYLSEEIRDYIHIKAMDSNIPAILDAELNISFDELLERLVATENYLVRYPESRKYREVLGLYEAYLGLYMTGSDNSPIYDYETKLIKEEVRDSYRNIANNKDIKTSQVVTEYMDIIEENENKIDSRILSDGLNLRNQAIIEFEK